LNMLVNGIKMDPAAQNNWNAQMNQLNAQMNQINQHLNELPPGHPLIPIMKVYNAGFSNGFLASVRTLYDGIWTGPLLKPPASSVIQLLRNHFTNLSKIRLHFASGPGFTVVLNNAFPFSLLPDVVALAAAKETEPRPEP